MGPAFACLASIVWASAALGEGCSFLETKFTVRGESQDYFGWSVALDGDRLLVGRPRAGPSVGAAYLYDLARAGPPIELLHPNGMPGDRFGDAVALGGGRAVIGAYLDDEPGNASGSAHTFAADSGDLLLSLTAQPSHGFWFFGASVAVTRDGVLVGAPVERDFGFPGKAYLFDHSGRLLHVLTSGLDQWDGFGASVAMDGDWIAAGAIWLWQDGVPQAGGAFVLDRASGAVLHALAQPAPVGGQFGSSAALAGTTAVIGAPGAVADEASGTWGGAAYVFDVQTGEHLATLAAPDAADGDEFGSSVAIGGGWIAVGAPSAGEDNRGAAYLFDATSYALVAKVTPSRPGPSQWFGYSVALSAGRLAVGEPNGVDELGVYSGAAYVFGITCPPPCPGDLAPNDIVDAADLAVLLGAWGDCAECAADLDRDGVVDAADLGILLGAWGRCS